MIELMVVLMTIGLLITIAILTFLGFRGGPSTDLGARVLRRHRQHPRNGRKKPDR